MLSDLECCQKSLIVSAATQASGFHVNRICTYLSPGHADFFDVTACLRCHRLSDKSLPRVRAVFETRKVAIVSQIRRSALRVIFPIEVFWCVLIIVYILSLRIQKLGRNLDLAHARNAGVRLDR